MTITSRTTKMVPTTRLSLHEWVTVTVSSIMHRISKLTPKLEKDIEKETLIKLTETLENVTVNHDYLKVSSLFELVKAVNYLETYSENKDPLLFNKVNEILTKLSLKK